MLRKSVFSVPMGRLSLLAALAAMACVAALGAGPASAAKLVTRGGHAGKRHHRHHLRHRSARANVADTASSCAGADTPAERGNGAEMDAAVTCLVNDLRAFEGLPRLTVSAKLDGVAQGWTNWMVSSDQFTHGTNFAGRVSASGYDWQTAGENIVTGTPTPRAAVLEWLGSTDHCRNMLDPQFRNIGVGVLPAAISGYAYGGATWTQDFGLTQDQSPLSGNTGPMNGCPY